MLSQRAIENRLFGSTASVEPFWGGLRAVHPCKGRKKGVKSPSGIDQRDQVTPTGQARIPLKGNERQQE